MKDQWLTPLISRLNLPPAAEEAAAIILLICVVLLGTLIITFIVRRSLLKVITHWIQNNRYRWDDPMASNKLLNKVSLFVPIVILTLSVDSFLSPETTAYLLAKRIAAAGFVVVSVLCCSALLATINDIYRILRAHKGSSIRGYTDAGKIIIHILGAIFILSIFTGKSPWGIFSIMGGLTAVTMLVFKDSILGFVASIQLNSADMVRIGDWVEMDKYGADGDVIEVSIHAVKVQNWDKTITTIPPYALVSNSFKNWRGMSESGGRRIKRSLAIDISSIKFCDEKMVERYTAIPLISDYVRQKQDEIRTQNGQVQTDSPHPLSGRSQTNVGIFRAYIIRYLKDNTKLHQSGMTFLVRQLAPSANGLPLEIYVFSKDQRWAQYEDIQADIFDHLLAAAPLFELQIFQNPSGYDLRTLGLNRSR